MMVKSGAIFQILVAVKDLPAYKHSQGYMNEIESKTASMFDFFQFFWVSPFFKHNSSSVATVHCEGLWRDPSNTL